MKAETDFEKTAATDQESSFAIELWTMLRDRKKYWLMPVVIVLLLFGVLVFLSGTAAAPFIYTLF
jgi:drug/metabolite transporter superfamily protein YnfA